MDENEQEVTLDATEQETEVEQVDEVEAMRAELEKAKQIAENQRIRAEKAEAKAKAQTTQERPSASSLNAGDMMAIKNADLDPQDMDLVEKFARDNNMSLREALAHPHAKAILAYEAEVRTTAIASNVDGVRRGTIKVTDDTLLQNASANKLPTTEDDIERLVSAKMKMK